VFEGEKADAVATDPEMVPESGKGRTKVEERVSEGENADAVGTGPELDERGHRIPVKTSSTELFDDAVPARLPFGYDEHKFPDPPLFDARWQSCMQ